MWGFIIILIIFIVLIILSIAMFTLAEHLEKKINKECPFCKELIKKEAIKCKHCQSVL